MSQVLGAVLPLQGWTRVLFQIGTVDVTVSRLTIAGSVLIGSLILARIVGGILRRLVNRRAQGVTRGSLQSTVRLVEYTLMIGGLLLALQTLGVRLAALFAAGALFAVALGFAMQNVIANFISGVILLLERSIKPGDIIDMNGQLVKIQEMGIRAAIGRTTEEEDLIIPSSQLVQSTVRNYTLRDAVSRLRVVVGVTYDSDMALVRKTLEKTAAGIEWRLTKYKPAVLMTAFGSSSVDFEVSVWFDDPWNRRSRSSDLHEAMWWALKEAGVVIAFPQVDVHFDRDVLEAWRANKGP